MPLGCQTFACTYNLSQRFITLLPMGVFDFIALVGPLQACIMAVAIFTNKVFQNPTNRYFAYFLLLLALIGFDAHLKMYYEGLGPFWALFFDIVGDDIPWIMLLYLPLFRFFMINAGGHLAFPFWWLTLPFWLFTAINAFIDLDLEFGVQLLPFFTKHRMVFYEFEDYISILLFSGLHVFGFIRFIKKGGNKWLIRLWWYTGALIVLWSALVLDATLFNEAYYQAFETSLWTAISLFVYWLMYSGLMQFNLANNRQAIRAQLAPAPAQTTAPKAALSSKSKTYFEQLMALMQTEKAYRNPDLGRQAVAQQLGISSSYLTQLIKEYASKSFTGFINDFRVEEVKQMLSNEQFNSYDFLSIGLEAGFKSKSTFYTTFKLHTGQTPSQFKKSLS